MVPLFTAKPFAGDMNLGRSYDEHIALIPEDAWIVLFDHDALPTTRAWWHQLQEAIAFKPDAGAFTSVTNRIAAPWQQVGDKKNFDDGYHCALGEERRHRNRTLLDVTETKGFGGVLICLSKAVWRELAWARAQQSDGPRLAHPPRVFADGMLCVDHSLHFALQNAGRRIWLLENLYLYHRRRAFVGDLPFNTPKAARCPCRGAEIPPTHRVALPDTYRYPDGL